MADTTMISKGRMIGEIVLVLFSFIIFSFISLLAIVLFQNGLDREFFEFMGTPAGQEALAAPAFLSIPGGMLLTLGLIWFLQKIRGETFQELGLKTPASWSKASLTGVAIAVFVFLAASGMQFLLSQFGLVPDSSDFDVILTDPMIFLFGMTAVAWLAAGFGEEVVFRGFIMRHLYQLFGSSKVAAGFAIIVQAAIFGALHLNQGIAGGLVVFMIAAIFGVAFYRVGRILWPLIIAHGLFDNIAFSFMYFGVGA